MTTGVCVSQVVHYNTCIKSKADNVVHIISQVMDSAHPAKGEMSDPELTQQRQGGPVYSPKGLSSQEARWQLKTRLLLWMVSWWVGLKNCF